MMNMSSAQQELVSPYMLLQQQQQQQQTLTAVDYLYGGDSACQQNAQEQQQQQQHHHHHHHHHHHVVGGGGGNGGSGGHGGGGGGGSGSGGEYSAGVIQQQQVVVDELSFYNQQESIGGGPTSDVSSASASTTSHHHHHHHQGGMGGNSQQQQQQQPQQQQQLMTIRYDESDSSAYGLVTSSTSGAAGGTPGGGPSSQQQQNATSQYSGHLGGGRRGNGSRGGGGGGSESGSHHHTCSHVHNHSHNSNSSTQSQQSYTTHSGTGGHSKMSGGGESSPSPFHSHRHHHHHHHHHRKRKSPEPTLEESDMDDDSETCSSRKTLTPTDDSSKKQNHSEIEKRRRDKMNTYITELSGMVTMCSAMSRKLDKLTVLRMAVQHMKTLRGSRLHSYTEGHYKPSFISDEELKHLILQSAEGFLFVVGCDRGRLLYVSESVSQVLNYSQTDLLGQSWFDILHPKDVAKVKEQLSSSDLAPRERLIDAKTMLPVKGNVPQKTNRLCPGARRSFFCRMKCKMPFVVKEEQDSGSSSSCHRRKKSSSNERKYIVIHCTGYLKSWAKVGLEEQESETEDPCNLSCLVAIGRILPPITMPSPSVKYRPITFISRHAIDGKFVFVDQRATLVVGYLPQELLGTSMYEYYHPDDIPALAESHKAALTTKDTVSIQVYRFRSRDSTYIPLQSTWKAFRNPWTKDIEYIISKNVLARSDLLGPDGSLGSTVKSETFQPAGDFEFFNGASNGNGVGREIQRLISTQVPVRKIGEQIADEIIETQRRSDSSSSNSPISGLDSQSGHGGPSSSPSEGHHHHHLPLLSPSPGGSFITHSHAHSQQSSPQPSLHIVTSSSSPSTSTTTSQQQQSMCLSPPNSSSGRPSSAPGESSLLQLSNVVTTSRGESPMHLQQQEGGGGSGAPPNDPVVGAPPPQPPPNAGSSLNSGNSAGVVVMDNADNRPIRVNGNNNTLIRNPDEQPMEEPDADQMLYMIGESVLAESPQPNDGGDEGGDGNDEAAMAVIMSLLEADAGLGGPVDFSGLPWPLP